MKDKRQLAIYNNNALYDEIFANCGIIFQRTESVCYCPEQTPVYYSNLVTLTADWKPDEIFEKIDEKFEKESWLKWSIKDSFAVLDLAKYGFSRLFDAQWIYLEAEKFTPLRQSKRLRFAIIDNESELAAWRIAWDTDEKIGKEIFSPKLLSNPKVYFLAGYRDGEIFCGCLVNKSDSVLGISNFFAPDNQIYCWSEIIRFIFSSIEKRDIVGYERNVRARELEKTLNFERVGSLIVWLKQRNI